MYYQQKVGNASVTIKGTASDILKILTSDLSNNKRSDAEELSEYIANTVNKMCEKTYSKLHLKEK